MLSAVEGSYPKITVSDLQAIVTKVSRLRLSWERDVRLRGAGRASRTGCNAPVGSVGFFLALSVSNRYKGTQIEGGVLEAFDEMFVGPFARDRFGSEVAGSLRVGGMRNGAGTRQG